MKIQLNCLTISHVIPLVALMVTLWVDIRSFNDVIIAVLKLVLLVQ